MTSLFLLLLAQFRHRLVNTSNVVKGLELRVSRYQRLHGRERPENTGHVEQVFFLLVGLGTEGEFRLHGLDDSLVMANLAFRVHVLGEVLVPDVEGPLVVTT